MGAPNFMKMLVQEIKVRSDEYMIFVKNGHRYAPWRVLVSEEKPEEHSDWCLGDPQKE